MTGEHQSLAAALVAFQARVKPITRSRTVEVRTKRGERYSFAYAPLEAVIAAVRDDLAACGLAVTQALTWTEGGVLSLRTSLVHESGERDEDVAPLPVEKGMTPQEIGSVITYMRRYAYTAVLGLSSEEDDDGNMASGNEAKPQLVDEHLLQSARAFAKERGADFDAVVRELGFDLDALTVDQARIVAKRIKGEE